MMAIVLKYFIVEAYRIPSGSMQPTLLGNPETELFDRILVDKLSYHYRDPERWEVAVFKYPLDRSKNFVKRIVGIGPEYLRIEGGDIWHRADDESAWSIPRRSRGVLLSMMRALDLEPAASEMLHGTPQASSSRWRPLGAHVEERWSCVGRRVEARGDGSMRFAHDREGLGSIMDGYTDGYPPGLAADVRWTKPAGMNEVGDLRVDGQATALAGLREFAIELSEGALTYRFTLPGPAAAADALPAIEVLGLINDKQDARVVGEAFRLESGTPLRFAVQNVDDLLVLELNGREALSLEIQPASSSRSRVLVLVAGEGVDLDDLQVRRDIYYTDDFMLDPVVKLEAGEYYMLGDNTQDSRDSRQWRLIEMRWPGAGSEGELVRGDWDRHTNPLTRSTFEGRLTFFRDEWGERHVFEPGSEERVDYVSAPAVPRHMIIGRALLVFWPWSWERRLMRLGWVR